MSDVIKAWLLSQLGIVFEGDKWSPEATKQLIAKMLHRYHLITEEQQTSVINEDENMESTFKYINDVINQLGIEFSARDFEDVLAGHWPKTTILFYELYLALHDKNVMHFIVERRIKKHMHELPEKFKVEKVESGCSELSKFDNALALNIAEHFDVVQWHKSKLKSIVDKCKASREAYLEYLKENEMKGVLNVCKPERTGVVIDKKEEMQLCSDVRSLNLSYEELLEEEKHAREAPVAKPDYKKAKGFMSSIKSKRKVVNARKENQERMQKLLLKDLWDKILDEQKEYYEKEFAEKLLKQTVYEQQMVTKLLEIREESKRMKNNKRKLMECIRAEHEQRFMYSLMNSEKREEREKHDYYAERERNLELHRRLYAQKLKRKALKHYDECSETVGGIVDITTFVSDYVHYYCQGLPKKKMQDLMGLFIKGKPIYAKLDTIKLLTCKPDTLPEDLENIYIAEIERDNCIDDFSFEAYCENVRSWRLQWQLHGIDFNLIKASNNILGFIVHRLLLTKYPKAPLPPPPEIPRHSVAVCANGVTDLKYIPALEKLLQARQIKVIQMQDAMNHCLAVWKGECTAEYLETALVEYVLKKDDAKGKKPEAKGKKISKKKESVVVETVKGFDDKNTQTPQLFPGEEMVLSHAGNLGRMTYEILNLGETPNDNLMVAMFVEYLKSLQDIEGWVLINYPRTIEQVAILEEALNSVAFPTIHKNTDSLEDIVDLELQRNDIKDIHCKSRVSKLLPNPKPTIPPIYNTYLTAYVEIRSAEGDDIEEQYYDCFRSVENDNLMNRFYMDQGCKYTLIYKEMDFPTIKHLGKLILGDYSLPRKSSIELFTDTVRYVEAEFDKLIDDSYALKVGTGRNKKDGSKLAKSKSVQIGGKSSAMDNKKDRGDVKKEFSEIRKSRASSKLDTKKGESKLIITHEEKETQIPEEDNTPAIEIKEGPAESVVIEPKPGQDDWSYVNLHIEEDQQKVLATIWENIERIYMNDMKLLFFRERIFFDTYDPFKKFLINRNRDFLKRPTDKNKYLHEFQVWYNELDDDMRADEEVKAELHMRIHEFQERLYKFCDDYLAENEEERRRIIKDDWLTLMLFELVNIYSTIMQLEIDRCADTMQLFNDYYSCMVSNSVTQERPLGKIKLEFLTMPTKLLGGEESNEYVAYYEKTMIAKGGFDLDSPYHKLLSKNEKACMTKLNDYKKTSHGVYEKLSGHFNPGRKSVVEPISDVKDRAGELLQEFQTAYLGELQRTEFRLQMAFNKGRERLNQLITITLNTFLSLHTESGDFYDNHIASVKKACGVFRRAVEEETRIQPEMVFILDKFYIKLDSVLYESELPESPKRDLEPTKNDAFTIDQLKRLTEILFDLAPNGLIPERAFTFLLQDLLVCDKIEDGQTSIVPELWKQLHPHSTHELMHTLFGDTEYIDWRDFIVYNLGIPFPTEVELMETRKSFRELDPDFTELVVDYQVVEVKFWFDSCGSEEEKIRLGLVKELLVRIFKIDKERINYTALLLLFCKDENPIAGLAKAVELSLGKFICWKEELGEEYFYWLQEEILRIKTEQRERELTAEDILSEVVDSSVIKSTCAYLEEYFTESVSEESSDFGKIPNENPLDQTPASIGTEASSTSSTFTNLSQAHLSTDKNMEYFLDFDTLINVLTVCLPWHARNKNVGDCSLRQKVALIYQVKANNEFNRVFTYQLFNEPEFVELIGGIYKFSVRNPCDVVENIINKQ